MSAHAKFLNPKVGAVTLASMLVTIVGLALLLAASDACALNRCALPTPAAFASEPVSAKAEKGLEQTARGWEDARESRPDARSNIAPKRADSEPAPPPALPATHRMAQTAYIAVSHSGGDVFVYTRNAEGQLTDPD